MPVSTSFLTSISSVSNLPSRDTSRMICVRPGASKSPSVSIMTSWELNPCPLPPFGAIVRMSTRFLPGTVPSIVNLSPCATNSISSFTSAVNPPRNSSMVAAASGKSVSGSDCGKAQISKWYDPGVCSVVFQRYPFTNSFTEIFANKAPSIFITTLLFLSGTVPLIVISSPI